MCSFLFAIVGSHEKLPGTLAEPPERFESPTVCPTVTFDAVYQLFIDGTIFVFTAQTDRVTVSNAVPIHISAVSASILITCFVDSETLFFISSILLSISYFWLY